MCFTYCIGTPVNTVSHHSHKGPTYVYLISLEKYAHGLADIHIYCCPHAGVYIVICTVFQWHTAIGKFGMKQLHDLISIHCVMFSSFSCCLVAAHLPSLYMLSYIVPSANLLKDPRIKVLVFCFVYLGTTR